jgi:hypothetical protein
LRTIVTTVDFTIKAADACRKRLTTDQIGRCSAQPNKFKIYLLSRRARD